MPISQKRQRRRRADIQVLRALAVSLVVLFHLGVAPFRGGFIGVDVFFVVSGYLVFGTLLREVGEGRFSALAFAARRMKRLSVPSAVALVLLTAFLYRMSRCVAEQCAALFDDIAAASLHYANLHFIGATRQYFLDDEPSIVLHFWSLAVEEQLYVVIPAAVLAFKLASRSHYARSVGPFLIVTSLVSLASVFVQPEAYRFYFIASRYWEFCVGALVAHYDKLLTFSHGLAAQVAYVLCWVSLVACGMAVPSAGYPNAWTVLVVLLTAGVIAFKSSFTCRPLEELGNMSYSIYLYHWPVHKMRFDWSSVPQNQSFSVDRRSSALLFIMFESMIAAVQKHVDLKACAPLWRILNNVCCNVGLRPTA
eukprot:m51a1_g579 hypothetical protein (365) ;mRNA; r:553663-562926